MNCLAGAVEEGLAQVDEPDATAADWYRKATEAGGVQAQSNYGLALMQGRGVPRDEKAAVDWFVRAADQGDPDVQNWLGLCYQDGRCGVLIDDAEAAPTRRPSSAPCTRRGGASRRTTRRPSTTS